MSIAKRINIQCFLVLMTLTAGLAGGLAAAPAGPAEERPSYFTTLWQLGTADRGGQSAIAAHRSNYALVFSYNDLPNLAPWRALDPPKTLTKPEVTFQLSFKTKIWENVLGREVDLWLGYTQRSFWQLYNFDDSSPFRETDYEPEVLLNFRTRFSVLGLKGRFVQVGVNHQSNGQSEPLSKSWNRVVANVGLERGRFSLLLKGWFKFPESAASDDNPGINKYMGYGEVWAYYFLKKHRLAVMLRDNLDFRENRGAVQLEWSFPLVEPFGIYVQYFLGYGESLLDYNHRVNRIGVGFIVLDWK